MGGRIGMENPGHFFNSKGILQTDPSSWHFEYVRNTASDICYRKYREFWECLQNRNLLPGKITRKNAWDLYKEISDLSDCENITKICRNFLISALQKKSTIIINQWIKNGEEGKRILIRKAVEELDKALLLIDSTYIPYKHLKSNLFFISSQVTKDKNDKIDLLEKAIDLDPDASHVYYAASINYFKESWSEKKVKNSH
jgi:hypothetical protein